jgi:hypothetical protein
MNILRKLLGKQEWIVDSKELLGSYIKHPSAADNLMVSEPKEMHRLVIVPTHAEQQQPFFSTALCRDIANAEKYNLFIESLAPCPMLSIAKAEIDKKSLHVFVSDMVSNEYRVVILEGNVHFGNFGGRSRYSFGSGGDLVSLAVESAILLPRPFSWVCCRSKERFNVDQKKIFQIRDMLFYLLEVQ